MSKRNSIAKIIKSISKAQPKPLKSLNSSAQKYRAARRAMDYLDRTKLICHRKVIVSNNK